MLEVNGSNIVIRANHGERRPQVRSKQLNKAPPLAIFHETYNGCRAIAVVNNDLCSSCPPIRRNVGSPTFDLSRNRMIVFFFLPFFFSFECLPILLFRQPRKREILAVIVVQISMNDF